MEDDLRIQAILGEQGVPPTISTPRSDNTSLEGEKTLDPPKNLNREVKIRYKHRAAFMLLFYIPVLVIPWALTCVLNSRPLTLPSYYNQRGQLTAQHLKQIAVSMSIIRIFNSIASISTIPIISSLLSQAAVVYAQRRKRQDPLSVRQLITLADNSWIDMGALWRITFAEEAKSARTRFLWVAVVLVMLSAIQQPLQQILVKDKSILVMSSMDVPFLPRDDQVWDYQSLDYQSTASFAGYDPQPGCIPLLTRLNVIPNIYKKTTITSFDDIQPHLWSMSWSPTQQSANYPVETPQTLSWYIGPYNQTKANPFFVSAIQNTINTGVLREHAMRFNSSVDCENILLQDFPEHCAGVSPFEVNYIESQQLIDESGMTGAQLKVRICVPGDSQSSIWTLTRDRQDVEEEMFLAVQFDPSNFSLPGAEYDSSNYDFALKCTAKTTRGYYELGNYRNNYTAGPLLEQWPDLEQMNDFNDYNSFSDDSHPTTWAPLIANLNPESWMSADGKDIYPEFLPMPGPLATVAIALFGNGSFLNASNTAKDNLTTIQVLRANLCETYSIPFAMMTGGPANAVVIWCNDAYEWPLTLDYWQQKAELEKFLYDWFYAFNASAPTYLTAALFMTHETVLQQALLVWNRNYSLNETAMPRTIWSSPGVTITKPSVSVAGITIISSLILLQLFAIVALSIYIYHVPTWTTTFDSFTILKIGAYLEKHFQPHGLSQIESQNEETLKQLDGVDGIIGIEEDVIVQDIEDETMCTDVISRHPEEKELAVYTEHLGVGARGCITRRHARMGLRQEFTRPMKRKKQNKSSGAKSNDEKMIEPLIIRSSKSGENEALFYHLRRHR